MSLSPSALAWSVHALLATEHDPRPVEEVAPWVHAAEEAAADAGLDPRLVVAVGYVESRYRPVIGDRGRACGVYQYHVRFWRPVATTPRIARAFVRAAACHLLMSDPRAAARVAVARLAQYRDPAADGGVRVCHYNQGTRCRTGERYTGQVERVYRRLRGIDIRHVDFSCTSVRWCVYLGCRVDGRPARQETSHDPGLHAVPNLNVPRVGTDR